LFGVWLVFLKADGCELGMIGFLYEGKIEKSLAGNRLDWEIGKSVGLEACSLG